MPGDMVYNQPMKYTNKYHLSNEIVRAILDDDYDSPDDKLTIPCHVLINPPRQTILIKRHDQEIFKDVSEEIWALLGRSVHYVLAKQDSEKAIVEKRIQVQFKGHNITGKPDYFNPETGVLKDFKVTSVWRYVYGPKEGYDDWTKQLNVYAWLLNKQGYKVKSIVITAVLRDWQQREAFNNTEYPDIQIKDIPCPLWEPEEQERFISECLSALIKNDGLDDQSLDICTPSERWASPTTWAVRKEGRKTAVRVFDNPEEAMGFINGDPKYWVEERKGEDRRCKFYCNANQFCNYYKETYETRNT
jgi:hypothetical protein